MNDRGFECIAQKAIPKRKQTSEQDLLNDVLGSLCIDSSALYIFDFHEPWAFELQDAPVSISWTVMEGTVWLHGRGNTRIALHRGDTFLLPHRGNGRSKVVATHSEIGPTHPPISATEAFQAMRLQGLQPGQTHSLHASWEGQGPTTRVVSAAFGMSDRKLSPLIAALPELIVVRAVENGNDLVDILGHFALNKEGARQPGFSCLATQIAQLLLVHIVRTYALSTGSAHGWLAGLEDPQIARALDKIHRQPEVRWSVATLARSAGLSRSVFGARFYALVGHTAMNYLRAWRIHLARESLVRSNTSVSALSMDLGYHSEAAFRAAFRRATGYSPSEFRRLEPRFPRL